MNLYFELLKTPVFAADYINQYYDNKETGRAALRKLVKSGMVAKIRNNLYTCISGETGSSVANRYQIGSAVSKSAYISHHTAMEYYGVSNQVYYEVYVSSKEKFKEFEFDGYHYRFLSSKLEEGIEAIDFSGGVRLTNRERTVVDCIKDMEKVSGFEEVLENIEGLTRLDENKLLKYLDGYNNQFLYQKTGFLLSLFQEKFALSSDFFVYCKKSAGKSTRYLTKEYPDGKYDVEWRLVIPKKIIELKSGDDI